MSRLHNARKRMKTLLGPMLVALLWLSVCLVGNASAADQQPIIRFGVRVLQASNVPRPEPPLAYRRPSTGVTLPPPPSPPSGQQPPAPPPVPTDPRLERILPQLRMLFRYNTYTTLERHRVDGPLGTPQRFAIPGERWLEVIPEEMQGQRVRMKVRLFKGDRPEIGASIIAAPGAPAVLGGPPHGNGVLIIILWANPHPPPGP
jgi:hypothetical protein